MHITKADLSNIEKLAEMNKRLIEDEGHPNPMDVPQLAQRMRGWLQDNYTCYLVIEEEQAIAYCLFRDDGDYYYLRQLFVERTCRRRGIATKLLDRMYQSVWVDKKVSLDVLAHNAGAKAFYEAYGFQIVCLQMEK